jgi:ankyrin repeat protein
LRTAVKRGQIDAAREILARAPGVIESKGGSEGRTPLNLACRAVDTRMVKLLVEGGANLNAEDKRGNTPLLIALASRNVELIEYLCSKGANPLQARGRFPSAMELATAAGDQPLLDAIMRGWDAYMRSQAARATAKL